MPVRLMSALLLGVAVLLGSAATAQADPGDVAITSPGDSTSSEDDTPLIEGTADPSLPVHLLLDGAEIAVVDVTAEGTWSYQVTDAIAPDTEISIAARVLDGDDVIGEDVSSSYVLPLPSTIAITSLADGDVIGASGEVSGTVSPRESLEVTLLLNGSPLQTSTLDNVSGFTVQFDEVDAEGEGDLVAQAVDDFGRTLTSAPVGVVVDLTPPAVPIVTAPAVGAIVDSSPVTFAGTGEPGARIEIRSAGSGTPQGNTVVDPDGRWSFTTTLRSEGDEVLTPQTHPGREFTLEVTAFDAVGNVSFGDNVTFRFADAGSSTPPPTSEPSTTASPSATAAPSSSTAGGVPLQLANTGSSSSPLLVGAMLLLLVGSALIATSRPRRAVVRRRH